MTHAHARDCRPRGAVIESGMIAGIEMGGTKTVVALGEPDGTIHEEHRYPTTDGPETFARAIAWLNERGMPDAVGVAAFGPVSLNRKRADYGSMMATPKPGWARFSITGALGAAFPDARIEIETDVNAAALAEADGLDDLVYITIGTGVGGGLLSGGKLVHGALHPEFGHWFPRRAAGDAFAGVCPFHGDCLEGLASGPAGKGPGAGSPGVGDRMRLSRPGGDQSARHGQSVPCRDRRRRFPIRGVSREDRKQGARMGQWIFSRAE